MIKDSYAFCKTCENYQKLGSISKRHMMPLNPILVVDTRRRATAPLFVYLTKRVFFSIGGNKDFIGVAI